MHSFTLGFLPAHPILSELRLRYEAEGDKKGLALLKKISPAAWRHIHFQGHLIFSNDGKMIDLSELVKILVLSDRRGRPMTKKCPEIPVDCV